MSVSFLEITPAKIVCKRHVDEDSVIEASVLFFSSIKTLQETLALFLTRNNSGQQMTDSPAGVRDVIEFLSQTQTTDNKHLIWIKIKFG